MADSTVQELPLTNNNIDGWNRGFQTAIGDCLHIWKFLDVLKKHQALPQLAMTQIMAGDEIVQHCKYRDYTRRILNIFESYNNRHVMDYLLGVAY
jgi:hypothetical protein